jgi:predicted alpha/beta superfamily hydrolase
MRRIAFVLSLMLLALQARAADDVPPHDSFTMPGVTAAETRHINVYTPPGYATSNARYPVLYMPDGGLEEDFPHVAKALDEGIREGAIQPLILVGIENTERRRDMTGPTSVASDRQIAPHVGGSAAFRAFIASKLVPEVSKRYRVDGHRGVIGESLAGLFALETLQREPTLFDTVIAISPSVWWNAGALIGELPLSMAKGDPSAHRIYVTSADEDNIAPGVELIVKTLRRTEHLRADAIEYVPRPLAHHDTIYRESEAQALRWAYPPAAAAPVRRLLFVGSMAGYGREFPAVHSALVPPRVSFQVTWTADAFGAREYLATTGHLQITDVIYQEEGGDWLCRKDCVHGVDGAMFPPGYRGTFDERLANARAIADAARAAGARLYYLGAWDPPSTGVGKLDSDEKGTARVVGAAYIELALAREKAIVAYPGLPWRGAEKKEAGFATTVLTASRVGEAMFGQPSYRVPCVRVPGGVMPGTVYVEGVPNTRPRRECPLTDEQFSIMDRLL